MGEEKGEVPDSNNVIVYDGCEPVSCPNPKCNQELIDMDKDFWEQGDSEVDCRKCKQPVKHVSSIHSRKRPSKSIYIYRCAACHIKFSRTIPAMKRRCPACREEFYLFWNILLSLPGYSSRKSRQKVALQPA